MNTDLHFEHHESRLSGGIFFAWRSRSYSLEPNKEANKSNINLYLGYKISVMKSVSVFCGSSEGYNEVYREAAYKLGAALAEQGITVVYGGAKVGLMGALAEGVLQHKGKIIGVVPTFLKTKEVVHESLTQLITVETMHERKVRMHELSQGVIAMPGAWGTMDELFEMLTWSQLGLHNKPIGLLSINGYYEALKAFFDNMVAEGFLNECVNATVLYSGSIEDILAQMKNYNAPDIPQVITTQTT